MNIKNTKSIFYALLIFMSSIFAIEAQGQKIRIDFSSPSKSNVVLRELTSIAGTVSGKGVASVKIAIVKNESDDEWAYDTASSTYRWMTGPTGQWLATTLTGNSWSASSNLPSGSNLPNGDYVIYALAFDTADRGLGFQVTRKFTIRR